MDFSPKPPDAGDGSDGTKKSLGSEGAISQPSVVKFNGMDYPKTPEGSKNLSKAINDATQTNADLTLGNGKIAKANDVEGTRHATSAYLQMKHNISAQTAWSLMNTHPAFKGGDPMTKPTATTASTKPAAKMAPTGAAASGAR